MVYKGSSRSTLLKHLQGLHSEELRNATEGVKKTQSSLLDCGFKSVVAHMRPCSSLMLTTLISEMITHDMCPFSVVTNEGFRCLIHAVEPNYNILMYLPHKSIHFFFCFRLEFRNFIPIY